MASGFGYRGGPSRCFAYWQEFAKCYAQADTPKECTLQGEDYMECLHHKKANAREKALKDEFLKRAQREAKEGRKVNEMLSDGVVVDVGIIKRDKENESKEKEGKK